MDMFYNSLNVFLKETASSAVAGLNSSGHYVKLKEKRDRLLQEVESRITPETKAILAEYTETVLLICGSDCDMSFMYGLSLPARFRRICDESTPEYEALMDTFGLLE